MGYNGRQLHQREGSASADTDKGYCEWVCHQETTNVDMIEFGRFVQQVDANWEDHNREMMMQELEERERRLSAKQDGNGARGGGEGRKRNGQDDRR